MTQIIRVKVQTPNTVNGSVRRVVVQNAKLEELKNVDALTYGLEDGFTVVYDSLSKTWKTEHIPTVINEAIDLDGGTY